MELMVSMDTNVKVVANKYFDTRYAQLVQKSKSKKLNLIMNIFVQ